MEKKAIRSLNYSDRVRAQISSLVREFDDHLPGFIDNYSAMEIVDKCKKVDISNLDFVKKAGAVFNAAKDKKPGIV